MLSQCNSVCANYAHTGYGKHYKINCGDLNRKLEKNMTNKIIKQDTGELLSDIKNLIAQAKGHIVHIASSSMTTLYWRIGKRLKEDILGEQRAEYGLNIISNLAKILAAEYGKGFTYSGLTRMVRFYEQFSEAEIVATVSQQLTWSHIVELLPIEDISKREYYVYMSINERWSVRELRSNINKMIYERSSLAKKSPQVTRELISTIKLNQPFLPEIVLKDPYLLDFLELPDEHYENDLENAILNKIEQFLLELGAGFSFVSRQKKMTIDNDHFYLDLLFYNRKLNRLVAIELKTGRFKAEYKGQMELYLGWLKKNECFAGENQPIGIILCSEKSQAQVELLEMSSSGIHVAEYWSALPPIQVFEKKIQEIVIEAKKLYDKKEELNKLVKEK